MRAKDFLRSINLELDCTDPGRFAHFQPTSKSADLIEAVFQDGSERALIVVAPYGSGKSLTAGYLVHAIQNDDERFPGARSLLGNTARHLGAVRPSLAASLKRRASQGRQHGVAVSLYGHHGLTLPSLVSAFRDGFTRVGLGREARAFERVDLSSPSGSAALVQVAMDKLHAAGGDKLLLVWDEFGRHLEGLVESGQSGDLLHLQVLAEAVARVPNGAATVLLLLHRSFAGYTAALPSVSRREWSKIEGRFKTIQFIDDSTEAYRLLATVVEQQRHAPGKAPARKLATLARDAGIFDEVEGVERLLASAYPLEPLTLWLLPRVSARVAQNERTAFSFLASADLSRPIGPTDLYDYFRSEFRSDTEPGGTHRAWIEAESALSKVDDGGLDAEVIKAAFLLNLGLGGERGRASHDRLHSAIRGLRHDRPAVDKAIRRLLERKLLIHRQHSDHILVWHGTDVDLRGRLHDERRRLNASFDLVAFLSREFPPPIWRPTRHNADTGVPRYFESSYLTPGGLAAKLDAFRIRGHDPGTDGAVLYVFPATPDERLEAIDTAASVDDPRMVIAVAPPTSDIRAAAMDLAALLRMHRDLDLLAQDPLVKVELDQVTDDARATLARPMAQVLQPGHQATAWFHQGGRRAISGDVAFRTYLSDVMDSVFHSTPRIRSEMVVRRKPTAVIINARKKVMLGVLERLERPNLGIEGDFADQAVFRAVLLNTKIYRADLPSRLAAPNDIPDQGTRAVWDAIRRFLTEPKEAVAFQTLFNTLREPPYGVREGLLPILLAAALRAFPSALAIRHRGAYVTDILPSVLEDIAKAPADFTVSVIGLTRPQEAFLRALLEEFAPSPAAHAQPYGDLLRCVFDAIQSWWATLPEAALRTNRLTAEAKTLRRLMRGADPAISLLRDLPDEFGHGRRDLAATLQAVISAKRELSNIQGVFVAAASSALRRSLSVRGLADARTPLAEAAQQWANLFSSDETLTRLSLPDRGFITHLRRPHESTETLLGGVTLLLMGKSFQQWDDSVIPEFERRLRGAMDDIEEVALTAFQESPRPADTMREGIVRLAVARLTKQFKDLEALAGPDAARTVARKLTAVPRRAHTQGSH